ncbi:hypothetical protein OKW43_006354 [Paraburkholderia sp. WC7.3g]
MHIVVCIKQVPDSSQVRVHPVTNTIMHQSVSAIQFFTTYPDLVAQAARTIIAVNGVDKKTKKHEIMASLRKIRSLTGLHDYRRLPGMR